MSDLMWLHPVSFNKKLKHVVYQLPVNLKTVFDFAVGILPFRKQAVVASCHSENKQWCHHVILKSNWWHPIILKTVSDLEQQLPAILKTSRVGPWLVASSPILKTSQIVHLPKVRVIGID